MEVLSIQEDRLSQYCILKGNMAAAWLTSIRFFISVLNQR